MPYSPANFATSYRSTLARYRAAPPETSAT